jgi:hypothetical protein
MRLPVSTPEAKFSAGEGFVTHGRHPVWVDRADSPPAAEQPLDQQPVRPLHRHQLAQVDQPPAHTADPVLVMPVAATLDHPPGLVDHAARMFLDGPIGASKTTFHNRSFQSTNLTAPDGEVPWRLLTDGALTAQLPVAAEGISTDRREALVSCSASARASALGALPTTVGNGKDDP